jgi:hypothetical protein
MVSAARANGAIDDAGVRQQLMEKAEAAAGRVHVPSAVASAMGKPATPAKTEAVKTEAPAKPTTPAKTEEKPAAKEEPPFNTGDTSEPLNSFPENLQPWTREKCDQIVRAQMDEAGMTMDQKKGAVKKRGAEKLADLSDDAIEELRRTLWSLLTKRAIEAKAKK